MLMYIGREILEKGRLHASVEYKKLIMLTEHLCRVYTIRLTLNIFTKMDNHVRPKNMLQKYEHFTYSKRKFFFQKFELTQVLTQVTAVEFTKLMIIRNFDIFTRNQKTE